MQFNLVAFAIFAAAGAAMARPSNNAVAGGKTTNDESTALRFLLTNSPAGHQAEEDGPPPPGCYWDGTAPFCAGSCPTGYTEEGRGSCGDGACCWTGYKFLCCKTPDSGDS